MISGNASKRLRSASFRFKTQACLNEVHFSYRFPYRAPFVGTARRRSFHPSQWHKEEATGVVSDSDKQSAARLFLHPKSTPELRHFRDTLDFPTATHDISELDNPNLPEQEVVLHGYRGSRRDINSSLSFIQMLSPDLTHKIQLVSSSARAQITSLAKETKPHGKLKQARRFAPIIIRGRLKTREKAGESTDVINIKTKEVEPLEVFVLNNLPSEINLSHEQPPELRFLKLRAEKRLRDALAFRSRAATLCRDWLQTERGFTEIETPLLFKSTSEGAREFLVPTRRKGMAYALPQSPQQFKQILMASGFSKYFQMARCFRDEDLRADRQPEFTQLDMEMSFVKGEDVMNCIESLIQTLWHQMLDIKLPAAFPRITYHEAMLKYGTDKPDLRLDYQIFKIDHLLPADLISKISPLNKPAVDVTVVRTGKSNTDANRTRQFIANFLDHADDSLSDANAGAPGVFVFDSTKPLQGLHAFGFEAAEEIERLLAPNEGDLIILQARPGAPKLSGGSTLLGRLVVALHRAAAEEGLIQKPEGYLPLWVTDFPLFTPLTSEEAEPGQDGASGLKSTHHPFTSPKSPKDVDCLLDDPAEAIADHYDLVINGVELGGGSRRIHIEEMQRFIMQEILQMSDEKIQEFDHLLRVLRMGCPPHAGFALGFDRLIAVMLGLETVRDVMAFPKIGKEGEDYVVGAPSKVNKEHWQIYGLEAGG